MIVDHPSEERLGAFLDDELPDLEARALAAHLNGCAACAALARDIRSVSADLTAARLQAPQGLRDRVRLALAAERTPAPRPGMATRFLESWAGWLAASRRAFLPMAVSMALVALVSASATWLAIGDRGATSLVTHDLLTAHLRALAQGGAIQVASSDQHTVKPWFAGKVDFSPEAKDLSAEGFALAGGRLDLIDGRRVGALVYRRRLHLIDVFAWPAGSDAPVSPTLKIERGYGLLTWTKRGVVYWAVSDLDPAELRRLPDLL